jgi:MoaA/NifB/PqqE/SkfB family radical SAM enzyme
VVTPADRTSSAAAHDTTLDLVLLAITKKCPLSCDHCFEWEALNRAEKLSLADIQSMVAKFQARRVTRIQLSGGEPMLRWKDILEVLKSARAGTDFWILTSGFHVTRENARALKDAGLTGLSISLDHFDPNAHNVFRGSSKSWDAAIGAAVIAHEVGLAVTLSLCVTKEFISDDNLMAYARLAKQLGVSFIQLVEPRSVGHYSGKNVDLEPEHVAVLERFYEKLNLSDDYLDWPMIQYSGYQQRRLGCRGAGDRFLYVDTDGDMHACPFCQKKSGSALDCSDCSMDESIDKLRERGCHKFESSKS